MSCIGHCTVGRTIPLLPNQTQILERDELGVQPRVSTPPIRLLTFNPFESKIALSRPYPDRPVLGSELLCCRVHRLHVSSLTQESMQHEQIV